MNVKCYNIDTWLWLKKSWDFCHVTGFTNASASWAVSYLEGLWCSTHCNFTCSTRHISRIYGYKDTLICHWQVLQHCFPFPFLVFCTCIKYICKSIILSIPGEEDVLSQIVKYSSWYTFISYRGNCNKSVKCICYKHLCMYICLVDDIGKIWPHIHHQYQQHDLICSENMYSISGYFLLIP